MAVSTVTTASRPSAIPALEVSLFDPATDRERYERFHEIRTEVFCRSLGWTFPPASGNWHDPCDPSARCALAECAGEPVGILRALRASTAFPHRELFEPHLERCGLGSRLDDIGTLNALAVLPAYRRRVYSRTSHGAPGGTAAHLLLRACLDDLAADDVRVVLATVMGMVSARAFLSAGFRLLDLPRAMPGQRGFLVANVGLVIQTPDKRVPVDLARVSDDFAECHRRVCEEGSVEELFGHTPIVAGAGVRR